MMTFRAFFEALGDLHWLALVLGTVAAMAVGLLWYGPIFGKTWASRQGMPMQSGDPMVKELVLTASYSLLFNAGIQLVGYVYDGIGFDVQHALVGGLILALFVSGPALFSSVVWGRKDAGVFAIDAGFWFAAGAVCVMVQSLVA